MKSFPLRFILLFNPPPPIVYIRGIRSYSVTCLGDGFLTPIIRTFKYELRSIKQGIGVVLNVLIWHNDVEIPLDFHIFEDIDFNVMIGHPIEKLFLDETMLGKQDITLGKKTFSVPIIQTMNTEDDPGETLELPIHENPTCPPTVLKPIPKDLKYSFLNDDFESLVIISNKLSEEETSRVVSTLEKHRSVFDYSLEDLKGITPNLCTHRIPIDTAIILSREPQRRLNHEMRDANKMALKLLHAEIIYHVPHSVWVILVQVLWSFFGRMVSHYSKC